MTTNSSEFLNYAIHWGYFGIFLWFVTADQLSVIPEEITLLVIGYLAAAGLFNPIFAAVVCTFSFVAVDIAYYLLAKSGSSLIQRFTRSKWVKRYSDRIKKDMVRTLVILCFIPRMRIFGPILVGLLRLSFKKFVIVDFIALLVFSILYITLGDLFHRSLQSLFKEFSTIQHIVFIASCVILIILVRRGSKEKNTQGA